MSCCFKNYAKKTVVLTPQRPKGAITPLTSELARLEQFYSSKICIKRLENNKKRVTFATKTKDFDQ